MMHTYKARERVDQWCNSIIYNIFIFIVFHTIFVSKKVVFNLHQIYLLLFVHKTDNY